MKKSTIKSFCGRLLFAACMTTLCLQASAQDNEQQAPKCEKPTAEQMEQARWQKIAQRLMLSDKQSEKVAPMFAEYQKEMAALRPAGKQEGCGQCKEGKGGAKFHGCPDATGCKGMKAEKPQTDEEIKAQMKKRFETMRKKADIQEKYFNKFVKELTPRQAKYLINHACKKPKAPKMKKAGRQMPQRGMMPMGRKFHQAPMATEKGSQK